MTNLKNTKDTNVRVKCLMMVKENQWAGNNTFSDLESALQSIKLSSFNSGWYKPTAVKINGLSGLFMINEDGSLFYDKRITKLNDGTFLVEEMSLTAFNDFEKKYCELI